MSNSPQFGPPQQPGFNPYGAPLTPPQAPPPTKGKIPGWAWIFVVACALIPIVSLGGLVPIALGVGGAMGCIGVARGGMSTGAKVGVCVGITAVCWVGLIAFAIIVFVIMAAAE